MNPPTTSRRRLIPALLIAATVIAALFLLRRDPGFVLTGMVATDSVIVSSQIQGRIAQLHVREGDAVKEGQLLATIHSAESQAELSFYENSERQAAAMVAQAAADLAYQDTLASSQAREAEASLAAARSRLAEAEAEGERVRMAFERSDALRRSGVESAQSFDDARTSQAAASARIESARQQVAAASAGLDASRANASLVEARRAGLQAAQQVLAAAKSQREKAAARLAYAEIQSPIAGVVDVRAARQGEVVAPGQPVLTLVNPDDFWVRIDVEEGLVGGIKRGDRLTVLLPSGEEREGEVFHIAVNADYATQRDVNRRKRDIKTFEVRLRCDNTDRALSLGMTAYVTLQR